MLCYRVSDSRSTQSDAMLQGGDNRLYVARCPTRVFQECQFSIVGCSSKPTLSVFYMEFFFINLQVLLRKRRCDAEGMDILSSLCTGDGSFPASHGLECKLLSGGDLAGGNALLGTGCRRAAALLGRGVGRRWGRGVAHLRRGVAGLGRGVAGLGRGVGCLGGCIL